MAPACPSDNTQAVEQDSFWNSNSGNWDAHRIGWLIAGVCALVVRPNLSVLYALATTIQICIARLDPSRT